jgi:hypothetical protein
MVIGHFPEIQGFHPQLNEVANAKEFEQLDAFFAALSTLQSCYEALRIALSDKATERKANTSLDAQASNM